MITRELVLHDYNKLKGLSEKSYLNGKTKDCLDYISFLAFFVYKFYHKFRFCYGRVNFALIINTN